jgi:hypothetical protein
MVPLMNLFEPPHSAQFSTFCRSTWTRRGSGEDDAPERRIIHSRGIRLPRPAVISRLGLRLGKGYFKCGSDPWPNDWVSSARVLGFRGGAWDALREVHDVPRPPGDLPGALHGDRNEVTWFELGSVLCDSALVELRRSEVDGWWPSWNLAMSGVVLEGAWDDGPPQAAALQRRLGIGARSLRGLPRGVEGELWGAEVRYRTRFIQVGFRLHRAAFTFLSIDDEGRGRVDRNLLAFGGYDAYNSMLREHLAHGVRLAPCAGSAIASFAAHDVEGEASVDGPAVSYVVRLGSTGQSYRLRWRVREDGIDLDAERAAEAPLRAWESSAWHIPFDSRVTPVSCIGRITYEGETGMLEDPVLVHAPGFGTLCTASTGPVLWRSDSARPAFVSSIELKLGEQPRPEGDTLLLPGRHEARVSITVRSPSLARVRREAPPEVERAVRRCAVTALPFRPDTATLSNNGNSMHAPICMDNWSAISTRMGEVLPGMKASLLLRQSLDRWLDAGQGYASGPSAKPGTSGDVPGALHTGDVPGALHSGDVPGALHTYDDEYIMTPVACLLGLADHLASASDREWLSVRAGQVGAEIAKMRARDVDDDGLIESVHRLGRSGSHQWSTNFFDVVSFGWKDAFTNALLYRALRKLAAELPRLGQPGLAEGLPSWAERLRASYTPAFFNAETGWYAGWRCADNRLHDYAFLFVNGAAVTGGLAEGETARGIIRRLWDELARLGFDDFRIGLPWNLRWIPDEDMGIWNTGRPFGFYANGGVSMTQARHFIGALYVVGMTAEADRVLAAMCSALGDGSAFGGCASGVDLHTWDGTPCGYEGLLCDQLGVIASALERFGERP